VAVGPLLCCCTAGRVLASVVPVPAEPQQSQSPLPDVPAQRASTHSCCAHKHQRTQKPAAPKPKPSKPGEQCPCKDGASKVQATPTTSTPDLTEQLRVTSLDFVAPEPGAAAFALSNGHDPGGAGFRALPFLSSSDLLFSQHKLRC
jgi:hypothetical protein